MAISYASPLPLATFWNTLRPVSSTFYPTENTNRRELANGDILTNEVGVRLWKGSIQTRPYRHKEAEAQIGIIRSIMASRASFLVRPLHQVLSISGNPTLQAVSGGYDINMSGFAAGAVVPSGAYFSFSYDGGRRAFHQVVIGGTANGSGVLNAITVEPYIQPGWAVGANIDFIQPVLKAVYVPGSSDPPTIEILHTEGLFFEWQQTLRQ